MVGLGKLLRNGVYRSSGEMIDPVKKVLSMRLKAGISESMV
jgi:hypothetical protein